MRMASSEFLCDAFCQIQQNWPYYMVRHSFWQIANSHISSAEKIYVLKFCELLFKWHGILDRNILYQQSHCCLNYFNCILDLLLLTQSYLVNTDKIICWIRSIKFHRSLSYLTLDTFWRFDRNITFCLELNYVSVYCIEAPITHTLTHKQNIACSVIQPILVITSKQI